MHTGNPALSKKLQVDIEELRNAELYYCQQRNEHTESSIEMSAVNVQSILTTSVFVYAEQTNVTIADSTFANVAGQVFLSQSSLLFSLSHSHIDSVTSPSSFLQGQGKQTVYLSFFCEEHRGLGSGSEVGSRDCADLPL